jgi:hypothetical protein
MINLVLEDARQPAFGSDPHRRPLRVEALDDDLRMPLDFTGEPGHGEASFDAGNFFPRGAGDFPAAALFPGLLGGDPAGFNRLSFD